MKNTTNVRIPKKKCLKMSLETVDRRRSTNVKWERVPQKRASSHKSTIARCLPASIRHFKETFISDLNEQQPGPPRALRGPGPEIFFRGPYFKNFFGQQQPSPPRRQLFWEKIFPDENVVIAIQRLYLKSSYQISLICPPKTNILLFARKYFTKKMTGAQQNISRGPQNLGTLPPLPPSLGGSDSNNPVYVLTNVIHT